MRTLILTFAFICAGLAVTAQKPDARLVGLDRYFEKQRIQWNIPGMAIAIVKDGKIIHSKGYGVRDTKSNLPVTGSTLFAIASNTKSFTTAALATLVDAGLISWDDKVRKHLPYFQLYSPYVSEEMTIRDLVSHRSGLATFSGDLLWYGSTHSREEIIRRARHLKPVHGFREKFGYQNVMFIAAGEIIPVVTGLTWDEYVDKTFLQSLGMKNSCLSVKDLNKFKEVALPHNEVEGRNQVINWVNWDNMAPAGSILASADDVCQWLMLQLGQGTLNGKTYWSAARSNEMHEMVTPQPIGNFSRQNMPSKHFGGYGLGWNVFDFHGKKVVNHGGGYDGMISQSFFVPEAGLGAVILTNNNNWLPGAMMYKILDTFLSDGKGADVPSLYLKMKKDGDAEDKAKADETEKKRLANITKPSYPLAAYAGIYECPLYGQCKVWEDERGLRMQFMQTPLFGGTLNHFEHERFQLVWNEQMMLPKGMVQFISDIQGRVDEMRIEVENPDFDFSELHFKKLPDQIK